MNRLFKVYFIVIKARMLKLTLLFYYGFAII